MTRCVLCGSERPRVELREHYTRDYRGQQIVVAICVDAAACVERAVAHRPGAAHSLVGASGRRS